MKSVLPLNGLSWLEKSVLLLLAIVALAVGLVVEHRATRLSERRTDLTIYLGAAAAVADGSDPYDFATPASSHYNYPPFLAIVLAPLVALRTSVGPAFFPLMVALWYSASLLALLGGVHALASALESTSWSAGVSSRHSSSRRWWAMRAIPIVVCLPGIIRTCTLGQVDLFILGLLCMTAAAALRRQSLRAGLWLSVAIAIKLIPAFLMLYPLRRRDWRWLAGCAVGLFITWCCVPVALWGPARAWQEQYRWAEVVVLPCLGLGSDRSRDEDLTSLQAVNSQSVLGILHNVQFPERSTRAARPGAGVVLGALLVCGSLTTLTLWGVRRRQGGSAAAASLGSLIALMLLAAPVCHPHYFCHWLPLVMAILALEMERRPGLGIGPGVTAILTLNLLANALTSIPGLEPLRTFGLATAAGLLLWATAALAFTPSSTRNCPNHRGAGGAIPARAPDGQPD